MKTVNYTSEEHRGYSEEEWQEIITSNHRQIKHGQLVRAAAEAAVTWYRSDEQRSSKKLLKDAIKDLLAFESQHKIGSQS